MPTRRGDEEYGEGLEGAGKVAGGDAEDRAKGRVNVASRSGMLRRPISPGGETDGTAGLTGSRSI